MKLDHNQFLIFEAEINRLAFKAGIGDWGIKIEHKRLKNAEAQFESNEDNTVGYFAYSKSVTAGTLTDPVKAARHEFGHLLTARLVSLSHKRFTSEDAILAEEEKFSMLCERLLS